MNEPKIGDEIVDGIVTKVIRNAAEQLLFEEYIDDAVKKHFESIDIPNVHVEVKKKDSFMYDIYVQVPLPAQNITVDLDITGESLK